MAVRRSFQNADYGYEDDLNDDDDLLGGGGFGGGFGGAADAGAPGGDLNDPFGNGRDRPDAFYNLSPEEQQAIIDLQSGAIAGNQESAREIGVAAWMPNQPVTRRQQPQAPELPQGVSVEEQTGPESSFAQDTPEQSMFPDPVTMHAPDPMQTATTGPTRRTMSNAAPALFDESGGGARMFGAAGGLMNGGRGAPGMNQGGPTPTEMMLQILREMRAGG